MKTCIIDNCERIATAKSMCKLHYERNRKHGSPHLAPRPPQARCSVGGCEKDARSLTATLCPMHYHREYRHGQTDKAMQVNGPSVSHGRRYQAVTDHGHPLARAHGRVYVHRKVLYDAIGAGSHACHWCGKAVTWSTRGDVDGLYPDHINGIGDDNRPENLVPSCMRCNTARGQQAKSAAMRAAGWWSSHDTIAALSSGTRHPLIESPACA